MKSFFSNFYALKPIEKRNLLKILRETLHYQ